MAKKEDQLFFMAKKEFPKKIEHWCQLLMSHQKSIYKNKKPLEPRSRPARPRSKLIVVRPRRRCIGGALATEDDELLRLAHLHPAHPEELHGQVDGHG
jgi:hypothetical protein